MGFIGEPRQSARKARKVNRAMGARRLARLEAIQLAAQPHYQPRTTRSIEKLPAVKIVAAQARFGVFEPCIASKKKRPFHLPIYRRYHRRSRCLLWSGGSLNLDSGPRVRPRRCR